MIDVSSSSFEYDFPIIAKRYFWNEKCPSLGLFVRQGIRMKSNEKLKSDMYTLTKLQKMY